MKIIRRCHTEKRIFGPAINPNSKLGGFISAKGISPEIDHVSQKELRTRVSHLSGMGSLARKEDLLWSEINSCYEYVCMYIFANIANIA